MVSTFNNRVYHGIHSDLVNKEFKGDEQHGKSLSYIKHACYGSFVWKEIKMDSQSLSIQAQHGGNYALRCDH